MSDGNGRLFTAAGGLAAILLLGAASVAPPGKPQSDPQAAPAATKPDSASRDSLTAYERESLAVDRAANGVAERANLIAEAQRSYSLWQLVLGGFGVGFTGVAAFWAWRATHWAKEAATQAKASATADNEALKETRKAARDARKDAKEQAARFRAQMDKQQELVEFTAKTAYAMDHAATANRRVAVAMRESAEAITRQANIAESTARMQLRAYVYAEGASFTWAKTGDPVFSLKLRNSGLTPAIDVTTGGNGSLGGIDHFPAAKPGASMGRIALIGAGEAKASVTLMDDVAEIRAPLISEESILHIAGRIEYDDIFGDRHETEFAFYAFQATPGAAMTSTAGHRPVFRKLEKKRPKQDEA